MPTYLYECKECGIQWDEVRRISHRDEEAQCPCGGNARRMPTVPLGVSVGSFQEGYNPAFGKSFSTEGQLKEELARIKHETGKELVEVGNDSMQTIRKEKKKVDIDAMSKELKQRLTNG